MSSQLILSIKEAMVRFKDKPIFEDLNFNLHQKSRIALVGKNGSGKTTLMKMIAGEIELEEGERWLENKIEIGYLNQEFINCLLYTSPSPRDGLLSRMPSSA